jgi:predicted acylesterase/phospholipase RssA
MAVRVQLAIQGGGAKLALLLAAAEPLQTMIGNGDLTLTRVVGTSAGAIAGALLAADISIEAFRRTLLGKKASLLSAYSAPSWTDLLKLLGSNGNPIWSEDPLKQLLESEFKARRITTIAEVEAVRNTKLLILRTNLSAANSEVVPATEPIVGALLDSCGLPFCFRTWQTGPMVDGGVTSNFGWHTLAEPPASGEDYGPVLGIMFDREPPNTSPRGPKAFCLSLLGASIDSATERARQSLGKGQIFSIAPRFGTLEIEKGLNQGLDQDYALVKAESKQWFEDFVEDPEAIRGDIWSGESLPTMTKTARMYRQQHGNRPIEYKRCAMRYYAHGLSAKRRSDMVSYQMEFHTLNYPVYCHKLSLSQIDGRNTGFLKSAWALSDKSTKRALEVTYVPIVDESTPTRREVLAYFNPTLDPHTGPYVLKVSDSVVGLSEPLRGSRGRDQVTIQFDRSTLPIPEIHIVVYLPRSRSANAQFTSRGGQHPGEPMSPFELSEYDDHAGYTPLGWKGENIPPGYLFGPDLIMGS